LKERDRLEEQVQRLVVERKYVERIEVAEAKLAIEREVFGPAPARRRAAAIPRRRG